MKSFIFLLANAIAHGILAVATALFSFILLFAFVLFFPLGKTERENEK